MAIFRVQGIKTTTDLQGIGIHNFHRVSEKNKDIDHSRSDDNITLKNCGGNYALMFDLITRDLEKQHNEQMKTTRKSRQKSFKNRINDDKADVACEFLMTASPGYFEGKSREEIESWAQTSLDFITKKIGIEEKNILHAVVHMDEKTPHLHVVAVPLIEKYDGRRKEDVLAISRRQFIKETEDMETVQTDYVSHLNRNGFDLERGLEKSGTKHLEVIRYKITEAEKELGEKEKELNTTENILLEKKVELSEINKIVEDAVKVIPNEKDSVPFLKKEVETKVVQKILGKAEVIEKESGNYVLTLEQFRNANKKVNAAVGIKEDYERLKASDPVKENEKLEGENVKLVSDYNKLVHRFNKQANDYDKLSGENITLKSRVADLTIEIKSTYQSVKEFIDERTRDASGFRNDFGVFMDKVKEKTSQLRKRYSKEPQTTEFEEVHRNERRSERDKGLER